MQIKFALAGMNLFPLVFIRPVLLFMSLLCEKQSGFHNQFVKAWSMKLPEPCMSEEAPCDKTVDPRKGGLALRAGTVPCVK